MARARRTTQAGGREDGRTRRITAPISEELFCAVGAYSKFRNVPLTDIFESALFNYLKARDFPLLPRGGAPGDDPGARLAG